MICTVAAAKQHGQAVVDGRRDRQPDERRRAEASGSGRLPPSVVVREASR